jgi:hypothetical protein
VADPGEARGGKEPDPAAGLTEAERARAVRTLVHRLQAGGIAFLAVVCLGLLPAVLSTEWPALGHAATFAIWVVAPAIPIGLLVFAASRLRR